MTRKKIITGINGFVGHHVAKQFHDKNIHILGVGNQLNIQKDLEEIVDQYVFCDLTDPEQVKKLNLSNISVIINLAGFAKVGESKGQGSLYNKVNIGVHTVLYDECIRQKAFPRIIAISTGAVYDPSQNLPITEDSRLISKNKTNEYVVSKQLMEESLDNYRAQGLKIITVRPFNHSGPGQLPGFLLPDLGEQITQSIKENKPLMVGNLDTKRDYTDVRDVARAYVTLATCDETKLKHNIYNVCSGKSIKGKEILDYLTTAYDVQTLKTAVDPKRIRKNEIMDIYGSHNRITEDTGWTPKISVQQMVTDYATWRKNRD